MGKIVFFDCRKKQAKPSSIGIAIDHASLEESHITPNNLSPSLFEILDDYKPHSLSLVSCIGANCGSKNDCLFPKYLP